MAAINLLQLKRLATKRSFARGEAYFKDGRVHSLANYEGMSTAIVSGQHDYCVTLRSTEREIDYSCDCPVGFEGEFCKHLVAVGLALLEPDLESKGKPGRKRKRAASEDDLGAYLERQDRDTLVAILRREAMENRGLRDRLLLDAARSNPAGFDISAYRRSIANATRTNGFVDYHSAYDYTRRILQVIESIGALLHNGHAPAVIELAEYALAKLEDTIGDMDDSDGYMSDILPELHDLHHKACLQVGPDPRALARRLFEWEMKSDWDIFSGAADIYADVFGAEGLAEYRRLAESEWAKVRQLQPGDRDDERSSRRFRVTHMMEALARQTGDPEALVEIKRRDLSHAYSFLQIAEIYREAGQHDKALDWAEQGMKSFPQADSRLVEFLAVAYHRRSRHDDAMTLIWNQFVESPFLKNYQELKAHALRVRPDPDWHVWRDKALTHLRGVSEKEKREEKASKNNWHWGGHADNSRLVEVFLWEKRYDEAWQEASAGGCSSGLWLRVAAAREEKHPGDAVPVYKEMIAPILKQANNTAYAEAVKLLQKIRQLMGRADRVTEFEDYLAALRVEYKRKRNFIKLLDRIERL
jgi:tetratricopeptide (TPR) repeat protein